MYVTLLAMAWLAAAVTGAATAATAYAGDAALHTGAAQTNTTVLLGVVERHVQPVAHAVRCAYRSVIVWPIYRLYRYGPALHGYGFWRGAPAPEVCAQLTHVAADFWAAHPAQCEARMLAEVDAAVVLMETLAYFALLYVVVRWGFRAAPGVAARCWTAYHRLLVHWRPSVTDNSHGGDQFNT